MFMCFLVWMNHSHGGPIESGIESSNFFFFISVPGESERAKSKPVIYVEIEDSLKETTSETVMHVKEHSVMHVHCLTLGSDVRWKWSDSSHPESTGENVKLKVLGADIHVIYSKLTVTVSRDHHGQSLSCLSLKSQDSTVSLNVLCGSC